MRGRFPMNHGLRRGIGRKRLLSISDLSEKLRPDLPYFVRTDGRIPALLRSERDEASSEAFPRIAYPPQRRWSGIACASAVGAETWLWTVPLPGEFGAETWGGAQIMVGNAWNRRSSGTSPYSSIMAG